MPDARLWEADRSDWHARRVEEKLAASAAAAPAGAPPGGAFTAYWGKVVLWKVESRYQPRNETEARELYEAITHDPDGVLQWIKNFW